MSKQMLFVLLLVLALITGAAAFLKWGTEK